ncbi:MAG: hypothetical protein ACYDCO_04145 [Armatimonadota bacterium]
MEEWKNGRLEGWKVKTLEEWRAERLDLFRMDAECQPEGLEVNSPGLHEATPGKGSLPTYPRRQDVGAWIAGSDYPNDGM